jgi:hypothetical protein
VHQLRAQLPDLSPHQRVPQREWPDPRQFQARHLLAKLRARAIRDFRRVHQDRLMAQRLQSCRQPCLVRRLGIAIQ